MSQIASVATASRWGLRALLASVALAIAAFAWLRFTDNTADNDLWGHVLYGERVLLRGALERTEVLSWTAAGLPWINHEFVAEFVMGLVHKSAGGTGLWVMMVAFGLGTAALALAAGRDGDRARGWAALLLFAPSINPIATGYAMRPQLFTMLAIVLLVVALRRLDRGPLRRAVAIPCLFAAWVNSHGGYLAGLAVVGVAAAAWLAQARLAPAATTPAPRADRRRTLVWFLLPVAAFAGALCNPWGGKLIYWTAQSVFLPRPAIGEWHPLGFSGAGLALIGLMVGSAAGWILSRAPRRLWEIAALALLAAMALRSQRHTPLFCLVNLVLTPAHLAAAAARLAPRCRSTIVFWNRALAQWPTAAVLLATAALLFRESVSAPREHPFTIEVEREVFPEEAVKFIRDNGLTGNMVTFFDWGQHVLWRLPDNPVSFDGRLDTVFPADVMDAHWRLYEGEEPGPALDVNRAEIALLPGFSPGADHLRAAGWTEVYRDSISEILVRRVDRYPAIKAALAQHRLPVFRKIDATTGRTPFPDELPVLATPAAPR